MREQIYSQGNPAVVLEVAQDLFGSAFRHKKRDGFLVRMDYSADHKRMGGMKLLVTSSSTHHRGTMNSFYNSVRQHVGSFLFAYVAYTSRPASSTSQTMEQQGKEGARLWPTR